MQNRYWELGQSPLFQILIPLTTGMVAGFWAQRLALSHLSFLTAALLIASVGAVALNILINRHPYRLGMHRLLAVLLNASLVFTGLILTAKAEPHTIPFTSLQLLRDNLAGRLQYTALTEREVQTLSAMLLGVKSALSPEIRTAFQTAGISHLLALSGLHIGMITMLANRILPQCMPGRKGLTILLTWAYIAMVGMPVSAVRAGLMLTLWLVDPYSRQHTYPMDKVALAGIILLTYNPLYLKDVGFQMSFAAVSSILLFQPSFRYYGKWPKAPQEWIWVCLAAQIGVMPLTFWYFGTFPTYFLLANLLITPILMPCMMYLGVLLLAVCCIMPQWSALVSTPLHILFELEFGILDFIGNLPGSQWTV